MLDDEPMGDSVGGRIREREGGEGRRKGQLAIHGRGGARSSGKVERGRRGNPS
jgi:hypothetical protein